MNAAVTFEEALADFVLAVANETEIAPENMEGLCDGCGEWTVRYAR